MKDLIALLGLKAKATEEDIVAGVKAALDRAKLLESTYGEVPTLLGLEAGAPVDAVASAIKSNLSRFSMLEKAYQEIPTLLGLPSQVTGEEVRDFITGLKSKAETEAGVVLGDIRAALGLAETATATEIRNLIEGLRSTVPAPVAALFSAAQVAEKVAAGLTKDQAIEALTNQALHDAAAPHDAVPVVAAPVEAAV